MSNSLPLQAMLNARGAPLDAASAAGRRGCPLSDLRDRLRRSGLRPTRQRLSLGWLLFGRGDRHLTAEMLYDEAMRAKVPVSLATVYNTLHQFTEAGLLRQLALDGSKAYFDTNPSEHHHFFLEDEGQVLDMPDCGITVDSLPDAPEGHGDRRGRGYRPPAPSARCASVLNLYGLLPAIMKKARLSRAFFISAELRVPAQSIFSLGYTPQRRSWRI